jgi:hypothetical protein
MIKIIERKISILRALIASDEGLSIPEVLIAIGLSGLLALGCTQLALASFSSANYTQSVAVRSLSTGTINRVITSDIGKSSGFLVSSGNISSRNMAECSTNSVAAAGLVKPLLTAFNLDGSSVGYEIRSVGSSTALWRVSCPNGGIANGNAQILASDLPQVFDAIWVNSVMCASYPSGSDLTVSPCIQDTTLNSIVDNPGIIFTVPATISSATVQKSEQKIIAARNLG